MAEKDRCSKCGVLCTLPSDPFGRCKNCRKDTCKDCGKTFSIQMNSVAARCSRCNGKHQKKRDTANAGNSYIY